MATAKKLNAEDLSAIEELRTEFQDTYGQIGLLSIDEKSLEAQLEQVKSLREEKFNSFKDLRVKEEELMTKFRDQYGDGQINLADGTFTPADETFNPAE
jgi:hypothetical protein